MAVYYLIIVISVIIIHLVNNYEAIFKSASYTKFSAIKEYQGFLLSVLVFFLCDLSYAIADLTKITGGVFTTSCLYFVAMSISVVMWARFITAYLRTNKIFNLISQIVCGLFVIATVTLIIINLFMPFMFEAENELYVAKPGVSIILGLLAVIYILTALYCIYFTIKAPREVRYRRLVVTIFSAAMATTVIFQLYYPLLPLYSLGIIICISLLHSFVFSEEKKDLNIVIEKKNKNIASNEKELGSARILAYTDSLTGVKNKHAYVEEEDKFDVLIRENKIEKFAVVVFDLNDLKIINDNYGHESGDRFIIKSTEIIKKHFPNMDIYRYGGDEFTVILLDDDYENRKKLFTAFKREMKGNVGTRNPVIATGISEFIKGKDNTFKAVFNRADLLMYKDKQLLKGKRAGTKK